MTLNFKAITVLLLCCAVGGFFLYTTGRKRREVEVAKETARSLSRLHGSRARGRTSFNQQQQQQQPQQQQPQKWELERQQHRDLQQQLQQPQQKQQLEQRQEQQQPQENQNRELQRTATTLPTTIITTTILGMSTTTRPLSRMATARRGNKTMNMSVNRGRWNKTMGGVRQKINYKRYKPVPMTPDNATYYSLMPKWIRECKKFYLDIGSGAGLTVKRLINPAKYRGNRLSKYHEEKFGSDLQTYGKKDFFSSHLCVLGFEPKSVLYRKLMQLESDYRWLGYKVHFFNFKVSDKDEHVRVPTLPGNAKQQWSPLKMTKHPFISVGGIKTKSVKLSGIINKVLKAKPITMIRINIEDDEFKILSDLLSQGLLCHNRIELILVQLRNPGVAAKQPNDNNNAAKKAEFDEFVKRVGEQTCKPTKIKEFNEKSFTLRYRDDETAAQRRGPNGPKGESVNMRQRKPAGGAFNGGVPQNLTRGVKTNANLGDGGGVNREGGMRPAQRRGPGAFNGGVPQNSAGGDNVNLKTNVNVAERGGVNREGGMREGRITTGQGMGREGVVGRQLNTDRRGTA